MKIEIAESNMSLRESRYYTVLLKFKNPINIEKVIVENPNVDYFNNDYDKPPKQAKIVCGEIGTILLWNTGARIPRLPKNRGDELTVTMLERYLMKALNGESRGFIQWIKEDFKEFAKEIGVIE